MDIFTLQTYKFILQALLLMEISKHTLLKRGWQGNTPPMAWSTFWVHISDQMLSRLNRSV